MRIKQAYISNSIKTFRLNYLSKFGLTEFKYSNMPVVIFGMYDTRDYQFFLTAKEPVVVWCGSDSGMITLQRAGIIKCKKATHIVKSKFMSDDLNRFGIPHTVLPISWQTATLNPCSRGENIFHYGNGINYGEQFLPIIRKQTGLNVISTNARTFDKHTLYKIYESCFIGLRLTKHDGLPNTVLELGMMGRRSLYNGGIPGSICWKGLADICQNIMKEYYCRGNDDTQKVSNEVKNFINIGDYWLNV